MTDEAIAHIAHEAIRAYCDEHVEIEMDGWILPPWELAPDWMVESAVNGVKSLRENPYTDAEGNHADWCEHKKGQGWIHGSTKDPALKQHPCLVPWDELPTYQRIKNVIFVAVVRACLQPVSRLTLGGFRG